MTSDKHKLQCDTGLHSANNKTIACYMQCILSISQAVSIPFTLFDALTRSWPLPYSWLSCRFARESRMFYKWTMWQCWWSFCFPAWSRPSPAWRPSCPRWPSCAWRWTGSAASSSQTGLRWVSWVTIVTNLRILSSFHCTTLETSPSEFHSRPLLWLVCFASVTNKSVSPRLYIHSDHTILQYMRGSV